MPYQYCTSCGKSSDGSSCTFCGKPFQRTIGGAYWTVRDILIAALTIISALILLFGRLVRIPMVVSFNLHSLAFGSLVSGQVFEMIAQYSSESALVLVLLKILSILLYAAIAASIVSLFRKIDTVTSVLRWALLVIGAALLFAVFYTRGQLQQTMLSSVSGAVRLTPGLGVMAIAAAIILERSHSALPRVLYRLANARTVAKTSRMPPTAHGALVCTRGAFEGARFDLAGLSALAIGRSPRESQIVFPKGEVQISRKHVLVQFNTAEKCYYVTDCSRNGTFLAGGVRLPVGQPYCVSRGMLLYLDKHGKNAFLLE